MPEASQGSTRLWQGGNSPLKQALCQLCTKPRDDFELFDSSASASGECKDSFHACLR